MVTLLYSTNNQVQMRLEAMENQLDAIHQKLEDSIKLFVPKRGRAYSKGEEAQREVYIAIGGVMKMMTYTLTPHILLIILCLTY